MAEFCIPVTHTSSDRRATGTISFLGLQMVTKLIPWSYPECFLSGWAAGRFTLAKTTTAAVLQKKLVTHWNCADCKWIPDIAGSSCARSVGTWMGSVVWRPGDHSVHILPAGRRDTPASSYYWNYLWPWADPHGFAGNANQVTIKSLRTWVWRSVVLASMCLVQQCQDFQPFWSLSSLLAFQLCNCSTANCALQIHQAFFPPLSCMTKPSHIHCTVLLWIKSQA